MELISKCASIIAAKIAVFVADLRGVSTVEYALMVVAVIAAVALAAALLGDAFKGLFTDLSGEIDSGITAVQSAVS